MTINFVKRMAEQFKKDALKGGKDDPIVERLIENSKMTLDLFVSYLESSDALEKNQILLNKLREVNHAQEKNGDNRKQENKE